MSDREFVWETVRGCADPWVEPVLHALDRIYDEADETERQLKETREALARAVYIAEHLFQMVSREQWRDTGGDDGQGHYEGDYHAEQVRDELASLAVSPADTTEGTA